LGVAPQVLDPTPPLPTVQGGLLGGAFSGFSQMQNYNQSELQNQLMKAQLENEKKYGPQMRYGGQPNVINNYDADLDYLNGL
jgi:hypothetical protein